RPRLSVRLDGGDLAQEPGPGLRPDEGVELQSDARELRLPLPPHGLPALAQELVLRRAARRSDHARRRGAGRLRTRAALGSPRTQPRRRDLPHLSRPADAALPAALARDLEAQSRRPALGVD